MNLTTEGTCRTPWTAGRRFIPSARSHPGVCRNHSMQESPGSTAPRIPGILADPIHIEARIALQGATTTVWPSRYGLFSDDRE